MADKTKLRQAWSDMIRRCSDSRRHNYHRYGGRGIKVCEEWFNSFEAFSDWSKQNGFDFHLTLDREDSDKNYNPENCRWVPVKVQANNTCTNVYIEHEGQRLTYAQWEDKLGGCRGLVWNRINMGWNEIDAITIPPKKTWSRHIKQSSELNG